MDADIIAGLNKLAEDGAIDSVFLEMRKLPLETVGELLLDIEKMPLALRNALPRMASDEVQKNWTGNCGNALLQQSLSFVRSIASNYAVLANKPLDDALILDYGCGWGRLLRLMYKYSSPERIYGCDAWDVSLDLCKESGIKANLAKCDEVPVVAPFDGVKFDLIYAFSVFTHLSSRTALAVMTSLRARISEQGIAVVTIRPIEYWDAHDPAQSRVDVEKMKSDHVRDGFAFTPHNRPPVDGDVTYGDASMATDYIARSWKGWSVVKEELYDADPWQRIVFLKPV